MEQSRYHNSKIYKLTDNNDFFYIGSTCSKLSKRFNEHKTKAKMYPKRLVYQYFNCVGWETVKIVLIEEHVLQSVEQLRKEEDRVIRLHKDNEKCLNSKVANRTEEELKEYKKNWRESSSYMEDYYLLNYGKYKSKKNSTERKTKKS